MNRNLTRLLKHYAEIEATFTVIDGSQTYATLVTASQNQQYPIQRWFHLKEAYSLDLLGTLLVDWKVDTGSIHRVLDPFCGTGTSLLALQKLAKDTGRKDLHVVGIERNPFLHFVASTRSQWHQYRPHQFETKYAHLLDGAPKPVPQTLPDLSTLHRKDVFSTQMLKRLLAFQGAITNLKSAEKSPLLLGYASVLEQLSGVRKDGRALRIVPNKQRPSISRALAESWQEIADDIRLAPQYFEPITTDVYLGDGRTLQIDANTETDLGSFDLVAYSPPYLNNIDYTEVYKIELWMCGFVASREDFRALRYRTFRSHPSVRFLNPITIDHADNLQNTKITLLKLIDALPKDKDRKWRSDLFKGYFDDIYIALSNQRDHLRDGGWVFCIVGNSLHGSSKVPDNRVPVASDLIIALIAREIGLEVKAIQVARNLKRRTPDSHYLRESIIVMQKPKKGI